MISALERGDFTQNLRRHPGLDPGSMSERFRSRFRHGSRICAEFILGPIEDRTRVCVRDDSRFHHDAMLDEKEKRAGFPARFRNSI
jgi:hypothetical protein